MTSDRNDTTPISRVRRRNNTLHITRADGSKATVAIANTGPYQSRVSYGYDRGAYTTQAVTR